MNVEFKDGSVCYVSGHQYSWDDKIATESGFGSIARQFNKLIEIDDFQINKIRTGDYIPASELDTEQKYNDVVEVFGLFGFKFKGCAISEYRKLESPDGVTCCSDGLWQTNSDRWNVRQLTYPQIIAIGKLKRMMLEREFKAGEKTKNFDGINKVNAEVEEQLIEALKCDEEFLPEFTGSDKDNKIVSLEAVVSDWAEMLREEEWLKIGCSVAKPNCSYEHELLKLRHNGHFVVAAICNKETHELQWYPAEELVKPKTPAQKLSEELSKKGVQDVVVLANQIINGEFDCLKYILEEERKS